MNVAAAQLVGIGIRRADEASLLDQMEEEMDEKHFAEPMELSDKELDTVAAAGGYGGGDNFQIGLVNVNDTNIGVNVLGVQLQGT
jgi:hypothetical protein